MRDAHTGHRERMRRRFLAEGFRGFEAHEILEMLLYYAMPMRNVNEEAHALINTFSTLDGVLRADPEELTRIPGIGEQTAKWLNTVYDATEEYTKSYPREREKVQSLSDTAAFAARNLHENACIVSFGAQGSVLHVSHLEADWGKNAVAARALQCHARQIVLLERVQEIPSGIGVKEVKRAGELFALLDQLGISLVDYVVFAGSDMMSYRECGVFRETTPPGFPDWLL